MSFKLDRQRLYFVPLGGSGQIGMNLNVYIHNNSILLVDMGVSFSNSQLGMEVTMPDIHFLRRHTHRLAGLVLTHAHEDHYGAIPHLWPELQCPVYATAFSAELLRLKLRESRVRIPEDKFHVVEPMIPVEMGSFRVSWVPMTHSIPENHSLIINTSLGSVVHTGDWNLDSGPMIGQAINLPVSFQEAHPVLAVISDSTNIMHPNASGTEQQVAARLEHWIGKFPQRRVVITCFASNVGRLRACLLAAQKQGRKPFLLGRSLKRFYGVAKSLGMLDDMIECEQEHRLRHLDRGDVLLITTGSQGEERAALSRLAHDKMHMAHVEAGDVVIFSSRLIPGNELLIYAIQNALVRKGVRLITLRDDPLIHVSGHPSREEIKQLYETLQPALVVPVHGEDVHMQAHVEFAESLGFKAIRPANGGIIDISSAESVRIVGRVHTGQVFLDGQRLLPCHGQVIQERTRLASQGLIVVSLSVNKGKIQHLKVRFWGLFEEDRDGKPFEERIQTLAEYSVQQNHADGEEAIANHLEQGISEVAIAQWRKRPVVQVHVLGFPSSSSWTNKTPPQTRRNLHAPITSAPEEMSDAFV